MSEVSVSARAVHTESRRIMLVDGDEHLLSLYRRMLGRSADLVGCKTGFAAAKHIESDSEFDVIVCEVAIHDGDGLFLYEWLRRTRPHLLPRMVFLTAGLFSTHVRRLVRRTGRPCLEKPFTKDAFKACVQGAAPGWGIAPY